MTATANDQKTGRAVAGEELFESVARFVVIHNGQSPERAERIADQAVAFLVTAATATVPMVPSDDVDHGLHALILHTKEYAGLCERYAGRFLHHNPKPGGGGRDLEKVAASARAMKAAGFVVLDDLWTVDGTNLAQCDSDCGRPYGQA
ncbi:MULTISPECIES: glycine-rich domain-containing protein [Streptomyces]|uniref:glycine-rich domain-containing protein n=1 Tax=Streptomyces TaxID=1883 RepID=UPI00339EE30D